jgi:hypothetical protein
LTEPTDQMRAFDLLAPAGICMESGVGEDYKELARARLTRQRTSTAGAMITREARVDRARAAATKRWQRVLTSDATRDTVEVEAE